MTFKSLFRTSTERVLLKRRNNREHSGWEKVRKRTCLWRLQKVKGESLSIQKSEQRSGSFTIKLPYLHLHIKNKSLILLSCKIRRRIPKTQRNLYQGIFVLPSSHWAKQCMNATILTLKESANSLVHVCTKHETSFMTPPALWWSEGGHLSHTAHGKLFLHTDSFFFFFVMLYMTKWRTEMKSLSWKFTSVYTVNAHLQPGHPCQSESFVRLMQPAL